MIVISGSEDSDDLPKSFLVESARLRAVKILLGIFSTSWSYLHFSVLILILAVLVSLYPPAPHLFPSALCISFGPEGSAGVVCQPRTMLWVTAAVCVTAFVFHRLRFSTALGLIAFCLCLSYVVPVSDGPFSRFAMWPASLSLWIQALLMRSGLWSSLEIPSCRALPGDPAWPTTDVWDAFNASVDGRLIETTPIGSSCHDPYYDFEACEYVKRNWHEGDVHISHPSSIIDAVFLNKSCDPFTPRHSPCYVGSYVQYAVNVSEPTHIIKTVKFAKKYNIRFVVKNTGHDYMGRSTGSAAISVWTHHLKQMEWFDDYPSPDYNGSALKVQAGVQGAEVNAEATKHGRVIVAGECPTVGFAGGYIQGGGHSVLSSVLGMAADHTLQFEVITTTGEFVTASPTQNQDLYWALSGGGGGTYGIVWSVVVKAHPDMPITKAIIHFDSEGLSREVYWEAITAYQRIVPTILDTGAFLDATYDTAKFRMAPLIAPNVPSSGIYSILSPWLDTLDALEVQYGFSLTEHPNYVDAVADYNNFDLNGYQLGGRLLPRSLFETEKGFSEFMGAIRNIVDGGAYVWDIGLRPSLEAGNYPNNAVHPEWRSTERMYNPVLFFDDHDTLERISADQRRISFFDEPLKKLSAGGGAYVNEADPFARDWKNAFYGKNYDRLLAIKDKWDPDQMMYAPIAVGGDRWEETEGGRLCRAH